MVSFLSGGAQDIVADAIKRIHQAAAKYRLHPNLVTHLVAQFMTGVTHHFPEA